MYCSKDKYTRINLKICFLIKYQTLINIQIKISLTLQKMIVRTNESTPSKLGMLYIYI